MLSAPQKKFLGEELLVDAAFAGKVNRRVDADAMQVFAHQRPHVGPSQAAEAASQAARGS